MHRPAALVLINALAGCGHPLPPPAVAPPPIAPPPHTAPALLSTARLQMAPLKLELPAGPTAPGQLEAAALFERAGQLLSARKYKDALKLYDELVRRFPSSRLVSPSLYNAGLAHEWSRDFTGAATRYRELMRRFGRTREALDAAFRLGGCYAELHNWPASAQIFSELLRRKDLSASDRIECLARKGLAYFQLGDHRAARSTLQEALTYHQAVERFERLDTDYFLAMVHYYQAAIPHLEFRDLKVDATQSGKGSRGSVLAQTLDDKARLLLLSQAAYIKTIQIKNPYWATAAGFQVGSLYRELYSVLLTTLPDFTAKALKNAKTARIPLLKARRQLVQAYLEEVHRTVKPLLDKAIRVFEQNLKVGERVGVQSEWVQKSRYQVNELKHLLSLPPAEAVKLVTQDSPLPEEQPGLPAPRPSPEKSPPRPEPAQEEEPGGVVL
jgi:tetratricopeptide (TPR) repeat protein